MTKHLVIHAKKIYNSLKTMTNAIHDSVYIITQTPVEECSY